MENSNSTYIEQLAEKMGQDVAQVSMIIETFVIGFSADLLVKSELAFDPFGTFELKKHLEYLVDNEDGTKTLYPPRLEVSFSSSPIINVLLPSEEKVLSHTYEELEDRYNKENNEVADFLNLFKATLKRVLLKDKVAMIPLFGTFEGDLGGKITFTPAANLAEHVNRPFAHFEPELINEDEEFEVAEDTNESNESKEPAQIDELKEEQIGVEEGVEVASPKGRVNEIPEEEGTPRDVVRAVHDEDVALNRGEETTAEEPLEEGGQKVCNKEISSLNEVGKLAKPTAEEHYAIEKLLAEKDKQIGYYRRLAMFFIILAVSLAFVLFFVWVSQREYASMSSTSDLVEQESANNKIELAQKGVDTTPILPLDSVTEESREKEPVEPDTIIATEVVISQPVLQRSDSLSVSETDMKNEASETAVEDYPKELKYLYHKLKRGDTLRALAQKYYKNKELWPVLVDANQDIIKNPNRIPVGEIIRIPKKHQ